VRLRGLLNDIKFILRSPMGAVGTAILSVLVGLAILAPVIAPYNPWKIVAEPFSPPSPEHPLGTNDMGQDLLSELLYGARISLSVGFVAAAVATLIGTFIGVTAGYFGGVVDKVVTGIMDTFLLMPALPLMLVMAVFLGPGYFSIILVIVITSWPPIARLVRSQTMSIKKRPYIEAALAIGSSSLRIMFKHVIPNVAPLVMALTILRVGDAMIAEAALSFLGLGDPTAKSWGAMLHWAFRTGAFSYGAWWWIVPPGVMIGLAVFGFATLGYALEEYVNPRLRSV